MPNTVQELIMQFQNEAVAYDKKGRKAQGSDRKKFRSLASITKDHGATIQEGFMLAFTRPLMELITQEFAKALVANARETDRGVGQAFKDSANAYIEKAAAMENQELGGVVFTKAILEYLNLVNWAYLGQYIEMLAGEIDVEIPVAKSCGRQDCKIREESVPDGWHVKCETCGRQSEIQATKYQAILKWNELKFDPLDNVGDVVIHPKSMEAPILDSKACSANLKEAGFAVAESTFSNWSSEWQEGALNYIASGGKMMKPAFLNAYEIDASNGVWTVEHLNNRCIRHLLQSGYVVPDDFFNDMDREERAAVFAFAETGRDCPARLEQYKAVKDADVIDGQGRR